MSQNMEKTPAKAVQKKTAPSQPGKIAEFFQYLRESRIELRKVVWPTRREVGATTLAVLLLVAVMVLYLGVVDFGLTKLMKIILS